MEETGKLIRISPGDLDGLLARIQEEKCPELILIGPRIDVDRWMQHWPPEYRDRLVFQLNSRIDGLERRLLGLAQLQLLNLVGNEVGDTGAQAIAQHLSQLTSLDLSSNQIGEAGAQAIAQHLSQLTSLHLGF